MSDQKQKLLKKRAAGKFVLTIDWLSSRILDNPYLFNYVRYILAGEQKGMKFFIKDYLEKYDCKTVADICSGTGDFAQLVSDDARYIGWDINDDFIAYARKRYKKEKNKSFTNLNVLKPRKEITKKFDAVMLISAIHHFSDEELEILLKFIKKITKKVVIIADIIPDPPHPLQRFFAKIDRGKFVRPAHEKIRILKKHFKVAYTQEIPTRSAVQLGIICEKIK